MEQLLMSRFITFLLHVAASTASTVLRSVSLYSRCFFSYCCMNAVPLLPPVSSSFESCFFKNLFPSSPCHYPGHPSFVVDVPAFLSLSFRSLAASQYIIYSSLSHSKPSASLCTVLCALSCRSTSLRCISWIQMNVTEHSQYIPIYTTL